MPVSAKDSLNELCLAMIDEKPPVEAEPWMPEQADRQEKQT
jgi:hypothetical protein